MSTSLSLGGLSSLQQSAGANVAVANAPGGASPHSPASNLTHFNWSPESLLIPGSGNDFIDLMSAKCSAEEMLLGRRLEFPPDVYPPRFDARSKLTDAIIQAGLKGNQQLVVAKVDSKNKLVIVQCSLGRTYYATSKNNDANKESNEAIYGLAPNDTDYYNPSYKDGIRADRIVRKHDADRLGGRSGARRTATSKPPLKCVCKFGFTLKLVPGSSWHLKKTDVPDKFCHNHPELLKESIVRRKGHIPDEEKENIRIYHRYANGGSAQWIANASQENGLILTRTQVRSIARDLDDSHYAVDPNDGPASQLMTILRRLSEEGHLQFTAVFHQVTETTLLAIDKAARKKEAMKETKARKEAAEGLLELEESIPTDVTVVSSDAGQPSSFNLPQGHGQMSLQSTLIGIRDRLVVGKKVLLAVAWTRLDERRLFDLFPEVLIVDVTFGTNDEARPQWVSAAFDGNMNVFTPVRAFLPSQCKWVFDWLFSTAMPSLLSKDALGRIRLVISDGDEKIYSAFDANQKRHYPNAKHGLCVYHLVTKHINDRVKPTMLMPSEPECAALIQTFKLWIFSWMQNGGVETEEEFSISHSLLRSWLQSFQQSENRSLSHNSKVLEEYLVKSVLPLKNRWFYPYRMECGLRTLNQKTSSPVEGVNDTIKHKSSKKVTPNMTIRESFQTQDIQVSCRMAIWHRKVQQATTRHPLWTKGSLTANEITTMGESLLQQRLDQRNNYTARPLSPSCIQVVRILGTAPSYCADCYLGQKSGVASECPACNSSSPIPKFRRVRNITFAQIDTHSKSWVVNCECCSFQDTGIPCQHLVKILPQVRSHHFSIRWLKIYPTAFQEKDSLNSWYKGKQCDQRMIISDSEHKRIFEYVTLLGGASRPSDFSIPRPCPVQRNPQGVISANEHKHRHTVLNGSQMSSDEQKETDEQEETDASFSLYGMGLLSQESSINFPKEDQEQAFMNLCPSGVLQTGHQYNDFVANIAMLTEWVRDNPVHKSMLNRMFYNFVAEVSREINKDIGTDQDNNGEFSSSNPRCNKRKEYKRLKSGQEIARQKKERKDISKRKQIVLCNSIC